MRRWCPPTLEREDRGVDRHYIGFRNLRRMTVAASLLSVPIWGALIYIVIHAFWKAGH